MVRHEGLCRFCEADFLVEFEHEEDELQFCPSCGEYLLEDDDEYEVEELDFEDDWD